MLRSLVVLKLFTLLAIAVGSPSSSVHAAEPVRPNIVFILADDLGYTDVACNGGAYYETPNIDRLAKEGLRFTDGYTCGPNCQPTRAALHSGQYGPRTGVYTVGGIDRFDWQSRPLKPVENLNKLPLEKITFAQTLKQAGYATAMFGKWHLGDDARHHPSQRGFDEAVVSAGKHFDFATNPKTDHDPNAYLADFLTDKAVDFIKRKKDGPFLLYLPHYGVHSPHQAKPELIAKFKDKPGVAGHKDPTYAAMISSVDESVGRIVALLEDLKIADNTLVIFTSDNGGVGGYEREGIKGGDITDNAPLRGGKGMLYEGGVRVPYVYRWKGKIPAGTTSALPINSVDLYPTLLELTGTKPPQDYVLDGQSYVPTLFAPETTQTDRALKFWHFPGYLGAGNNTWRTTPAAAVRDGDWKLHEFYEDGRVELYDLKNDIGEKHDLAKSNPAKTHELLAKLHAWQKEIKAPLPTKNVEQRAAGKVGKAGKKGKGKNAAANDD
ncbi:MAG: sulfatase [Pirellulales bacterium]